MDTASRILRDDYNDFAEDSTQRLIREDMAKEQFPMRVFYTDVPKLNRGLVQWHWHTEMEVNHVVEGEMVFSVEEHTFTLNQGDGFFVNSNVLHMLRPGDCNVDVNVGCVFSDTLIAERDTYLYNKYVKPVFGNLSVPYIILKTTVPWQNRILETLDYIYKTAKSDLITKEFAIRNYANEIWLNIYEHYQENFQQPKTGSARMQSQKVKEMCAYINENFADHIELRDIADHTHISVREVIRCFQNIMGITPHQYLVERRITAAQYLLRASDLPVIEVAMRCGFNNSSYFSKIFQRCTGVLPNKYRKGS